MGKFSVSRVTPSIFDKITNKPAAVTLYGIYFVTHPMRISSDGLMKLHSLSKLCLVLACGTACLTLPVRGADDAPSADDKMTASAAKSDADLAKKAAEWAASLKLDDEAKEARVADVITTHLKAIRDWHNDHSYTNVPAGVNPTSGKPLSVLEREMIMDSALPKSVHENLMSGLNKDLKPEQVEAVLDKYTVGKVAFTLGGYHSIVPDLTADEEKTILGFLKQAREQAVDYKNIKEISGIFEIYKTKCEQYLNSNGRNWHQLYKAYTDQIKAKKADAAKQTATPADVKTNSVSLPK